MSSSIAGVHQIDGRRFAASVEHAGDAAEQPTGQKLSLPDRWIPLLMELPKPKTAEDKTELNSLVWASHELTQGIQAYAERKLREAHADLQIEHERAKEAVREQAAVIEKMKAMVAQDTNEVLRAQNSLISEQSRINAARQARDGMSRFASAKEVAAAEKLVAEADVRVKEAEHKFAELGQNLNFFKATTLVEAQRKLDELVGKEIEVAAQLEGKDPVLARFGFTQR